ncbi:MAG: DUF952 domain-containing protein [Bauldia sp.]|nr:DUF952 domain-containing protein [Bauldia sp.]
MVMVYKVCHAAPWRAAEMAGVYDGSPVDYRDGFIHFSTAEQVRETVARHFRDFNDLVIVAVDSAALGDRLRWEPSRGGALFPHLYGPLPMAAVRKVEPLPREESGVHRFPDLD